MIVKYQSLRLGYNSPLFRNRYERDVLQHDFLSSLALNRRYLHLSHTSNFQASLLPIGLEVNR